MKYRAIAKHFLFEKGSKVDITNEDGRWLGGANRRPFTDNQLAKARNELASLVDKTRQRLVDQGILSSSGVAAAQED